MHRHRLGDGESFPTDDATEDCALIGQLPAFVAPGDLVVLVALVAIAPGVESGIFWQQRWQWLPAKGQGLLGIEVVDPVTVDVGLPETRLGGMQRRQRVAEFRGRGRSRGGRRR